MRRWPATVYFTIPFPKSRPEQETELAWFSYITIALINVFGHETIYPRINAHV